jgi:hypothetical protein
LPGVPDPAVHTDQCNDDHGVELQDYGIRWHDHHQFDYRQTHVSIVGGDPAQGLGIRQSKRDGLS